MNKATILLVLYKELRKGDLDINKIEKIAKNNKWFVTNRTLYRYMENLCADFQSPGEKIKVIALENNKKLWKIVYDGYGQDHITEDDIVSYFLLKNYLPRSISSNREAFFNKFYEWTKQKISHSNTHYVINNEQDCFYNTNFAETVYTEPEQQIFKKVIDAIQQHQSLNIVFEYDYTSLPPGHGSPLNILPLKIVLHRGTLHICYHIKGNGKLYLLAFDQIKDWYHGPKFLKSEIVENFDTAFSNIFGITNNIDQNVYTIELEISEMLGQFIKRREWHTSQRLSILENGNYLLTLQCGINRELVGWIFSWMTNIKVIHPPELVTIVRNKLEEMHLIYTQPSVITTNNTFK
jgi:predicted DNA-binding transcriptional regulator YafY